MKSDGNSYSVKLLFNFHLLNLLGKGYVDELFIVIIDGEKKIVSNVKNRKEHEKSSSTINGDI